MSFESIKEQFLDKLRELWARFQETSIYMSLVEKFEALSPQAQKAIVVVSGMLAVLFILSFPYSYISSSRDNMAEFEENRELIRGLLKASRTLREPSPLPPEIGPEALASMVDRGLDEFHLVPEQVSPTTVIKEKPGGLVPEAVRQVSVALNLKKLNVKQLVEISHRLQTLSAGVKLMGLNVVENKTSHYFDATFYVASFSIADMPALGPAGGPSGKAKSKAKAAEEPTKEDAE